MKTQIDKEGSRQNLKRHLARQKAIRENQTLPPVAADNQTQTQTNTTQATPRPWKLGATFQHGVYHTIIAPIGSGIRIGCVEYSGDGKHEANAALIVRAVNEYAALLEVAEAARAFERLKDSKSVSAEAYHLAIDATAKQSIGKRLTEAFENLTTVRTQ